MDELDRARDPAEEGTLGAEVFDHGRWAKAFWAGV
jgi:hypothetical protein